MYFSAFCFQVLKTFTANSQIIFLLFKSLNLRICGGFLLFNLADFKSADQTMDNKFIVVYFEGVTTIGSVYSTRTGLLLLRPGIHFGDFLITLKASCVTSG